MAQETDLFCVADVAGIRQTKACQQSQQRGLAAAIRAFDDKCLARPHVKTDAGKDRPSAPAARKGFNTDKNVCRGHGRRIDQFPGRLKEF